MNKKTDYTVGLTIPDFVKKELDQDVIDILVKDGHGISFPGGRIVQMRYIHEGKNLGGCYALSNNCDSWSVAISRAMADNQKLRESHPNSARVLSPDRGVRFSSRTRGNSTYFVFSVHYKKNGKNCFRPFYCGTENTMTTERKRHAQLTAWHFRRLYCVDGDESVLSTENISGWQTKQFYSDELKNVVPPHTKKISKV